MSDDRFSMGSYGKGVKRLVEGTRIITDTETGVQYLFAYWGEAGGITLLVDENGKPLIDKNHRKDREREIDMRVN